MAEGVIDFPGVTRLNGDPDRVLQDSMGNLESAIVIGFAKDGSEYFKSSLADGGDVLWLLERAKAKLLAVPDRDSDGSPAG